MPRRAKHPSVRVRRNADAPEWRKLPAGGRGRKPAPKWPLQPERDLLMAIAAAESVVDQLETVIEGTEDREERRELAREMRREKGRLVALRNDVKVVEREELQVWRELWKLPQAVQWELDGAERTVARYVRYSIRAELGEIAAARHVVQADLQLGISPKAMHALRWEIATSEQAEKQERDERSGTAPAPRKRAAPKKADDVRHLSLA